MKLKYKKMEISASRLSELNLKTSTRLTAKKLYSIALVIDTEVTEILEEVCKHLKIEINK